MDHIQVRQQATVFGFACRQTAALMPLPIWLAHKLARQMIAARLQRLVPYLSPDGKTQVGVEYRDRKPYRIHSISDHRQRLQVCVGEHTRPAAA